MPAKLQIVGVEELGESDLGKLRELSFRHQKKLAQMLNQPDLGVVVHVKCYKKKPGERVKYSVHVRAIAAAKQFTSSKAHDWDLARTGHKAFLELANRIEHTMKVSNQRPKRVGRSTYNPRKQGYVMQG